jgi:hypothetical protein
MYKKGTPPVMEYGGRDRMTFISRVRFQVDTDSHITNHLPFGKGRTRMDYFFIPGGGTGTRATPWHFPVPVLFTATRPDASLCVAVTNPPGLTFVVSLPLILPELSR